MLDRLKSFFETPLPPSATPSVDEVHLAAAALLVRAAQMDGRIDESEYEVLRRILNAHFGLDAQEADSLLELATNEASEANDLFQWTRRINQNFDSTHKITLIELLWQVVLADGVVDDYESNLLRRVAGLIHISDQEAGAARKRAQSHTAK